MNIGILLAGGTGTRLGTEIPKQYIKAGGRAVMTYSLECLCRHEKIDAVQIVAEPAWRAQITEWLLKYDPGRKFRGFCAPGQTRQLSVFYALKEIKNYAEAEDCVLIHDAARPLLSAEQVTECLAAVREGHDGALPVLPMKDTVYQSRDKKTVSCLLERKEIFAGQAPEAFRFGKYYEANRRLFPEQIYGINGSTEPAVLAGMDILMIPGDEENFKITTKADLDRFCRILQERDGIL
ncbi:MAG: 2-C-methyl-D-erythritol 4-phosphate cytidylyltransferase [Lachnospiraceae bacterium]|nr:2-C-methyl-D-erythritol 4-phosphate cytidylyltransferase [Lachnospiraceae bacterium]